MKNELVEKWKKIGFLRVFPEEKHEQFATALEELLRTSVEHAAVSADDPDEICAKALDFFSDAFKDIVK